MSWMDDMGSALKDELNPNPMARWNRDIKYTKEMLGQGGSKSTPKDDQAARWAEQQALAESYIKPIYDPYIQHGKKAYDILDPVTSKMASDPAGYLNDLMSHYTQSEAYRQKLGEMMKAAHSSAAAGGMVGTDQDQDTHSKLSLELQSEDMQNWLRNVFGAQNQGLAEQQHLYDTGYNASNVYGGELTNLLGSADSLAYQKQQAGKNDSKIQLGNTLGMIGTVGGGVVGGIYGGPMGAMAGSAVGGQVGQGLGHSFG